MMFARNNVNSNHIYVIMVLQCSKFSFVLMLMSPDSHMKLSCLQLFCPSWKRWILTSTSLYHTVAKLNDIYFFMPVDLRRFKKNKIIKIWIIKYTCLSTYNVSIPLSNYYNWTCSAHFLLLHLRCTLCNLHRLLVNNFWKT